MRSLFHLNYVNTKIKMFNYNIFFSRLAQDAKSAPNFMVPGFDLGLDLDLDPNPV